MQTIFKTTTGLCVSVIVALMFFGNDLSAQYVTAGDAGLIAGTRYRLTDATNSQAGAVWSQNMLSLDNNFTISAKINLGNQNAPGADGIAFVLQPVCNGLGGAGGGIGYFGINPSLAIEFDTYQNGDRNDPVDDHIALQSNGVITHYTAENLAGPFTQANMETGLDIPIVIHWNAATDVISLTYSGNPIFSADITASLPGIFGANDKVFWGFTAATGSENNLHIVEIVSASFAIGTPYTVTNASCPNLSDGSVDLAFTGGAQPLSYDWSDGSDVEDLNNVPAGTYSVSITDNNGCVTTLTDIVVGADPDNEAPVVSCPESFTISTTPESCEACVEYDLPTASDNCGWETTSRTGFTYKGTVGSSAYFLSNGVTASATVAINNALTSGGHLVVITDGAENTVAANAANGNRAWIGLSDAQTEGTYQWTTGEPFVYTSWAGGEPNNSFNEDFNEINRFGFGMWNDLPNPLPADVINWLMEIDGRPVIVSGPSSGDCLAPGSYPVTYEIYDLSGNRGECSFTITVYDGVAPTALCQDITVSPDGNGNYPIDASAVNNGSTDNCGIASITVDPSEIPCFHNATVEEVTLTVTDDAGNESTCTANVTLLGDDDCDGVGNACDLCNGGNDQIDNNNDGLPDCAYFTGEDDLYEEWVCGQNDGKVLLCHFPDGNPGNHNTLCIAPSAVQAHLDHGDYIGPCDNASCDGARSASRNNATEIFADMHVYPNPASDQLFLLIHGLEQKQGRILMYESTGKLVKIINVAEFTGEIVDINLSGFSQGVYYIAVETEGTTIERQRFVITR